MPFPDNRHGRTQSRRRAALVLAGALLVGSFCLSAASQPSHHLVVIEAMQFAPRTVEVNVGDTVVWNNRDAFPHTATSDRQDFHSGEIPTSGEWRLVVRKKGVFPYSCALHPTMHGTLFVK